MYSTCSTNTWKRSPDGSDYGSAQSLIPIPLDTESIFLDTE